MDNKKLIQLLKQLLEQSEDRMDKLDIMSDYVKEQSIVLAELEHEFLICKIKSCLLLGEDFTPV